MSEILLDDHSIETSRNVTCLGIVIDAELTFATHVKRVASRCFYQLRQLYSVRPALSVDNARMLAHAFVASRIDYCNSILYQTAAGCRSLSSSSAGAERCCPSGCKEEEMGQYYSDHS